MELQSETDKGTQHLPVLDVDIERLENGSSKFKIYRKSTHTDQYLNFNSHHPLNQKLGVIRTLFDRANALITDPKDLEEEINNIKQALRLCNYPEWSFTKVEHQVKTTRENPNKNRKKRERQEQNPGKTIILPYLKGLSESAARVFKKFNRHVSFKPAEKLGQKLFKLKDKADPTKRAHSIYQISCKNCEKVYIGETSRPLYVRRKEHQSETEKTIEATNFTRQRKSSIPNDFKSAITEHAASENHLIDWENTRCIEQVVDWKLRGIKEAIHIRSNPNNMNRPQGERYQLSHVWDTLLTRTCAKTSSQGSGRGRGTSTLQPRTAVPSRNRDGGTRSRGRGRARRS